MLLLLASVGSCTEPLVEATSPLSDPPPIAVPDEVAAASTAFINVHVVPMDEERILENQTVLVRDGLIVEMGRVGTVAIPDNITQVDGQGAYLMPGLADMHVHVTSQDAMLLYLAHGVTTIRVMWGQPEILQRRADVDAGAMIGPMIYTAGPGLEGSAAYWPGTIQLRSEEEARATVRRIHREGYDFIKTYNSLSQPVYDAILDEAQDVGIQVVGHIPGAVSVTHALEAGHDAFAHLLGYAALVTTGGSWASSLDENKALALAEATRNEGTWNCATFTVLSPSHTQPQVPAIKASAAWRYLAPSTKGWYDDPSTQPPSSRDPRAEQNRKRFVKMLHDAGAGLMLGTDTGVQYVLPGMAIHEELQHLADAGLTPYEVLRTGTVSPAVFLGMERKAGIVAIGHRADLLLVANNPLDDVAHVSEPIGVMTQGRWFSATKLQDMLDTLAESY